MAECHHHHAHAHDHSQLHDHGTIVTDPVCGMKVDTRTARFRHDLGGTSYFFCSARCLDKFKANPDSYLNPAASDPAVQHPAMGALPEGPQVAILAVPPIMDPGRFTQAVANNRGVRMRASDDMDELRSWLGI